MDHDGGLRDLRDHLTASTGEPSAASTTGSRFMNDEWGNPDSMRFLAIGLAIAVIVFVVTGGHVFFLPLLLLPVGLLGFGRRRRTPSRWS